jgi:HEAT repeat protein
MYGQETEAMEPDQSLQALITTLSSRNGLQRRRARDALVQAGTAATDCLIESLGSNSKTVRWEAAKALVSIADPKAAPAFEEALMDESFEVQWLAAEALIAIGRPALTPLLEGLIHSYGSVYIRQGVHHVLHDLDRRDLLPPATHQVLEELRCLEPLEPYPVSARRALRELSLMKDSEPTSSNS